MRRPSTTRGRLPSSFSKPASCENSVHRVTRITTCASPSILSLRMIGKAGDSRTSSVSGLNAIPSMVTGTSRSEAKWRRIKHIISSICPLLMSRTLCRRFSVRPFSRPWPINAVTSLGKQLPPNPQPGSRKLTMGAATLSSPIRVVKYAA